ncbi:type 1 glutamine amidotransferase [Halorubellus sp. JP-L1]|uniref:type 1 glutamine amidotransferase n=1 Tax=Halorubellus sp. JP-L1 TaxID=2715753 RepID=UPI00140A60AD|nr:type 1 glutamine amidotransferase [Halorubellus sp. JP-L1]NHN43451.1 type 1 glutamine amidotransferase [Halorubellus sp. JP-L1]
MRRPRIALVNAAHDDSDTRRNFRRELDADLVEFDANACELPEGFEYDAFVVTGSRSSVYEDEAWIDATREWVREAVDEHGLPALGVCWGHQLLADALGGTVADMGEYEIGYREVRRVDGVDDPLLSGVDDAFTVFTTHSDAVVELPPGATETARNDYGVHAFRTGDAFGVQFHPEYDPSTARSVTEGKDELPDERKDAVLSGITDEEYAAACEAKTLFENFTQFVRARATDDVAAD